MDNDDATLVFHQLGRPALESLARALDGQRLAPPFTLAGVRRHVSQDLAGPVCAELEQMSELGMSPVHMAHLLRVLARERASSQAVADRVELVWSGTEVGGSMSRDTSVVVQELFSRARRSVLVSSYAVDRDHKAEALFGTLAQRMDEEPALSVHLFLNVHRRYGDETPDVVLLREFAETFRHHIWPGDRMPEVFHDPRSLAVGGETRACLHAKCIVVDEQQVLISSANFTEAAHERNIEAGVLLTDGLVARTLRSQFESLVARDLLRRIPGL